jgi:iron(III) transport system substrate-binding protein
MTFTRRWVVPAAGLFTVGLTMVVGAAGAQELNATEKRLLAAAKAEGEVTVLNPLFADETGKALADGFRKRYGLPESFKVNNVRKGTGQVVAQARQEIVAGKLTSDVVIVSSPSFYDEAAKRGAFVALDSANWKLHEEGIKKAGQYASYPHVVTAFAYTFQPVWNAACPGMDKLEVDSYEDVVGPALKGKTIASDLSKSLTYTNTVAALIEAGAIDVPKLWNDLKATEPTIEFRTEAKMQSVISCERPLDMWNLAGRVAQNIDKKPELKKTLKVGYFKEGHVMLGNQAAVMKGAPHPNAGELFMEFMLSKEGADILAMGEGVYSFLKDYKIPEAAASFMRDIDKIKVIGMKDWIGPATQASFKTVRDDWAAKFQ